MLEKQGRVTRYRDSAVFLEGGQGNVTPVADPDMENLGESVDFFENWDLDGAIEEASAQRVGVSR